MRRSRFCRAIIPHCGARVGVAGGDLDIAQVHASIETGRDEHAAEHVRVRPGELEAAQAAGGRMAVHPGAALLSRIGLRTTRRRPGRWPGRLAGGSGTRITFAPLPDTHKTRWPCLRRGRRCRAGGLEDLWRPHRTTRGRFCQLRRLRRRRGHPMKEELRDRPERPALMGSSA